MLRYEFRIWWRKYVSQIAIILIIVLWYSIEAAYVRIPTSPALEGIDRLNLTYGTHYETVEEFVAGLSLFTLEKVPWDPSGISWVLPALAGVLIAASFFSREAEQTIMYGASRTRYFLMKTLGYYLAIWLMHGATLFLHIARLGFSAFSTVDWGVFLRVWVLRSLHISAWISPTVLLAFVLQDVFLTEGASYAYLFLYAGLMNIDSLRVILPMSYITQREIWQTPYDTQLTTQSCIVSIVYLLVFTIAAYVVFTRRDMARQT